MEDQFDTEYSDQEEATPGQLPTPPQQPPTPTHYCVPAPPPRKGIIRRALRLFLILIVIVVIIGIVGSYTDQGGLTERVIEGDKFAEETIAVIPLTGPIFQSPQGFPRGAFETFRAGLAKARQDPKISAVVIEIDSPGGGVTASDVLNHELAQFRASGIPVVAMLGSTAASGGYYVCAGADWIQAHPTTVTGSIGVIVMSLNYGDLLEMYGVHEVTIKSGEKKDILSPFRRITQEERKLVQELVDGFAGRFMEVVKTGRGTRLNEEWMDRITDGRILNAQDAYKAGLVDGIGYMSDAIAKAKMLGGVGSSYNVVRYQRRPGFLENLMSQNSAGSRL